MKTEKIVKKSKFLNLKLPLSGLLIFYGLVLNIYGIVTDKSFYQKSLGIDINLIWGSVMLIVGLALFAMYYFGDRKSEMNFAKDNQEK